MGEDLQKSSLDVCGYCRHEIDLKVWASEWDSVSHHYKKAECQECGKANWLKVDFSGSGHDHFNGKAPVLESIVSKVRGGRLG